MIFNPEKGLPVITTLRLTRYALFLRQFSYTIKFRPGNENQNVDYFSRTPVPTKTTNKEETYEIQQIIINKLNTPEINFERIQKETATDPELKILMGNIKNPSQRHTQIEYTIQNGIILRGNRVVIPTTVQKDILDELHSTHVGMVKMKVIARSICYWKNIDKDIEKLVKNCIYCAQNLKDPVKVEPHQWEEPKEPWTRVHADFAGPINGYQFLIIIDALTKYVEIITFDKPPTSNLTIKAFKNIFSTHGIPFYLVTDNATIFKSEEFTKFCNFNSIKQLFSAPGHPATNGQAERTVQTFKYKLKAMLSDNNNKNTSMEDLVRKIVFKYRTTPLANLKTPSELHFGRQIRSNIHMIRPPPKIENKQQMEIKRTFTEGQRILCRNYVGKEKWKMGNVTKRLGKLHYLVKLDNGYTLKRHVDQLRTSSILREEEKNDTNMKKETDAREK